MARDRNLPLIESRIRGSKVKRQRLLDAINERRKAQGLPAVRANVGDWKSFWETIKPFLIEMGPILLKMILALI